MELIDRYVNAIARRLPRDKRADVREELRANLTDALEARVAGEPTENDVLALLREFGRPEKVASSYTGNDFLIGPNLYPTFRLVIRIVLTVLATVLTLGFALALLLNPSATSEIAPRLGELLSSMLNSMISALGIIVLIFLALQRLDVKPRVGGRDWDPRRLPAVREADLVGRGEAIAGIVFSALFLVIVNLYGNRIGLVLTPGGKLFFNQPLVDNLLWLNASFLAGMLLNTWLLWAAHWTWPARLTKIGVDLFSVYVAYRVVASIAGEKQELIASGLPERAVSSIVGAAWSVPIFIAVIALLDNGKLFYRLLREPDGKSPVANGG